MRAIPCQSNISDQRVTNSPYIPSSAEACEGHNRIVASVSMKCYAGGLIPPSLVPSGLQLPNNHAATFNQELKTCRNAAGAYKVKPLRSVAKLAGLVNSSTAENALNQEKSARSQTCPVSSQGAALLCFKLRHLYVSETPSQCSRCGLSGSSYTD